MSTAGVTTCTKSTVPVPVSSSRGYYVFLNSHVDFCLMIGNIPLKICGYKTRAVINQEQLVVVLVWYFRK